AAVVRTPTTLGRDINRGDINGKDADGRTALHSAAAGADRDAVSELLELGADPTVLDSRCGASALHHAAQSGAVRVATLLLDAGAFLDLQAPRNGVTPLMAGVWSGREEFVAYLLHRPGINIELRSVFGATAAELIGFGRAAADTAGHRRDDGLRRLFADHRERRAAALAAQPLFRALTGPLPDHERAGTVETMLAAGARPDTVSPVMSSGSDGHTPLLVAARDGAVRAVAALLAAGADQTRTDHYMAAVAAHKAAYGGHAGVLRLLAAAPGFERVRDARGPFNGYTPLHDAAWHGHSEAALVLLGAGARTDVTGLDGRTPAELARDNGYPDLADLLDPVPSAP
ncbi:MAG TPA: ankyrin repeat domain-containing protein, partial [Pseudonocardiaceae bacterium]|nr:ankyrin repeat domain-containing protein [Pseudonocardiaceae bacterium]